MLSKREKLTADVPAYQQSALVLFGRVPLRYWWLNYANMLCSLDSHAVPVLLQYIVYCHAINLGFFQFYLPPLIHLQDQPTSQIM